jgi:hypothetical protein
MQHDGPPRYHDLALLSGWKAMPANWLACPKFGRLISFPEKPNVYFLPTKTPMPESFTDVLGPKFKWTISDILSHLNSLIPDFTSYRVIAVNVSRANEVIAAADWESASIKYFRIPIKRSYDRSVLDQISAALNGELATDHVVFIIYSGRGLTRVSFCLAGFVCPFASVSLSSLVTNFDLRFYKPKPIDVLSEFVRIDSPVTPAPLPDFLEFDDGKIAIGSIPLSLEKFKGIKKVSKKEVFGPEADSVRSHIPALPRARIWDAVSIDDLRRAEYVCSFEPRALRVHVIATTERSVFLVDSTRRVWLLKGHATGCHVPLVAVCYFAEEQHRSVLLMADLLLYGTKVSPATPLADRLSVLAHTVCRKLKFDPGAHYELAVFYRPMAKLSDVGRLRSDLGSLFVKTNGIQFFSDDQVISLPLTPSLILQVEYNGAGNAVLLGCGTGSELVPVALYSVKNPKLVGLNRRTSRFEYNVAREEWVPIALGQDDKPATAEEVQELVAFLKADYNIDQIFDQLAKFKI